MNLGMKGRLWFSIPDTSLLEEHTWSCFQSVCLHWWMSSLQFPSWFLSSVHSQWGAYWSLCISLHGGQWFSSKCSKDITCIPRDQNHHMHVGTWPYIQMHAVYILKNKYKTETQWSMSFLLSLSCGCKLTLFWTVFSSLHLENIC